MGTQLPSPKGAQPPIFGQSLLWPNGCMDKDGTWHGGGPWSRPHYARLGPSSPLEKRGQSPPIFGPFYCVQTAACIKMPLGMEVSLSPGDFVYDGTHPPPQKDRSPQRQSTELDLDMWPNGCKDQDTTWYRDRHATWYAGRPRPRRLCVRWGPSYPQKTGTPTPPNFWLMSIVACKTVGWIKMPLGTQVNLGPGDVVRWGRSSL